MVLPSRAPTFFDTFTPILVDPVAETSDIRWSSAIQLPTSAPPLTTHETPSSILFSFKTSIIKFWHATLQKGVFSLGFQIHTLPHTHARATFQLQTATGKLNAEIIPTRPKG